MSKLYIFTQNYENYGSENDPYWKPKGGSDYFVYDFDGDEATTIMLVRDQIECDNPFYRSQIAGWEVVPNNYLTEGKKMLLVLLGVFVALVLTGVVVGSSVTSLG